MMASRQIVNRCADTTATTGQTNFVLDGAVPSGIGPGAFQTSSALTDGDTYDYVAWGTDAGGDAWETGIGTWASGTSTLARTTVTDTDNGDTTKVTFTAVSGIIIGAPDEDHLANILTPSGSTFPTNPIAGQTFLLTLTNRSILYARNAANTAWVPQQLTSDATIYVDETSTYSGDDELGGDGTGNSALTTLLKARDLLPPDFGTHTVTIQMAAGTGYTAVTWNGFTYSGDFAVEVIGTVAYDEGDPTSLNVAGGAETVSSGSGGARGSTITYADIDLDATGTVAAAGAYDLAANAGVTATHWVEIDSTNECALILDHPSKTRLEIFGSWDRAVAGGTGGGGVPGASDTCKIWHQDTTITGAMTVTSGQTGIKFKRLALVGDSSSGGLKVDTGAYANATQCYISGGGNSRASFFTQRGNGWIDNCFVTNTSNRVCHATDAGSRVQFVNTIGWISASSSGGVFLAELGATIIANVCVEARGGSTAKLFVAQAAGQLQAGQSATLWTVGASPSSEVGLTLTKSAVGKNTNGAYNDFDNVSVDAAADEV